MKSDELQSSNHASVSKELANKAHEILKDKTSSGEQDSEKGCEEGQKLHGSLLTLSAWLDKLPEKEELGLALSNFQSQMASCSSCQGSATCWLLCGAETIVQQFIVKKDSEQLELEPGS